jgi:phosphatidylglycerophosphate synthase
MVMSQFRGPFTKLMKPLYEALAKIGISPNAVTMFGLGLSIVGGWAFASGEYFVAAVMIFLSGVADLLDGGIARVGGYASSEGAFLDSVADRLGESALYIGLVIGFTEAAYQLLALGILVFSFSISYLRARAEGLGVTLAGIGLMERAERMGALMIAALLAHFISIEIFQYALITLFSLVLITAGHRFYKVYDQLKSVNLTQV